MQPGADQTAHTTKVWTANPPPKGLDECQESRVHEVKNSIPFITARYRSGAVPALLAIKIARPLVLQATAFNLEALYICDARALYI